MCIYIYVYTNMFNTHICYLYTILLYTYTIHYTHIQYIQYTIYTYTTYPIHIYTIHTIHYTMHRSRVSVPSTASECDYGHHWTIGTHQVGVYGVCVCVCVCVYISFNIYLPLYRYLPIYLPIYIPTHLSTYLYLHTYLYMYSVLQTIKSMHATPKCVNIQQLVDCVYK